MLAIDIAHFLDSKGIGVYDEVGISGDIFIGSVPDAPDEALTIRPTGGTRTDPAQPYDRPTVQVIVRGRLDPRTASDRAQSVFDALNGFRGGLLIPGGSWIVGCQAMQSGPIHIGWDANGRHEYSINFELQILNTTRGVVLPFCHIRLRAQRAVLRPYPSDPKTLGDHLRKRIMDLGLTREVCVRELGLSLATISSMQSGKRNLGVKSIPKVIEFLGYNPFNSGTSDVRDRLVAFRKTHGLTIGGLAKCLGVSRGTVGRWESGKSVPAQRYLDALDSPHASRG